MLFQIWANMDMTDAARVRKRLWGMFWLVVVCFLNTFPLILISFLANLNAVRYFYISLGCCRLITRFLPAHQMG